MELPKVLTVNLVNRECQLEHLSKEVVRKYIGGQGINTYLLAKKLKLSPQFDPLSPENVLVFGSTPISHSNFSCGLGYTVSTISPLTQRLYHFSGNGLLSLYLKALGYDYLVVKGSFRSPACMIVRPEKEVLFFDAREIWYADPNETEKVIQLDHPTSLVLRTGTAASRLVRFATLYPDPLNLKNVIRGGVGAVLASKNLKAIAFQMPSAFPENKYPEASPYLNRFSEAVKKIVPKDESAVKRQYKKYFHYVDLGHIFEKNYNESLTEEDMVQWLQNLFSLCRFEKNSSRLCPVQPIMKYYIPSGSYQGEEGPIPNFEEAHALGLNLGLVSASDTFHLHSLCRKLGIDSLEMGYTLGAITDWYNHSILNIDDTKVPLDWGECDAYEVLIKDTAHLKHFGSKLSLGIYELAQQFGSPASNYCLYLKRQGMRYDFNRTVLLSHLVSQSGIDLNQHLPFLIFQENYPSLYEKIFKQEPSLAELNLQSPQGKGKIVWWHENYLTILRSLGLCHQPILEDLDSNRFLYEDLSEVFSITSGTELTAAILENAAQRIHLLQRQINQALGSDSENLHLPEQFPNRPQIMANLEEVLPEYYQYRGCDRKGILRTQALQKSNLIPDHPERC
jgi:aldehyde:ferredoxin oxidoreductase